MLTHRALVFILVPAELLLAAAVVVLVAAASPKPDWFVVTTLARRSSGARHLGMSISFLVTIATGNRMAILVSMIGIVAFGAGALYMAQSGHRLARPCTVLFVASIASTLVVSFTAASPHATASSPEHVPVASLAQVLALVQASNRLTTVPADLTPPAREAQAQPGTNLGNPPSPCFQPTDGDSVPPCVFGDTHATRTVVLYGDSHAAMWFQAIDTEAKHSGWKLVVLSKGGCPASLIPVRWPYPVNGDYTECDTWHRLAERRIDAIDPALLVVTQERNRRPNGILYTPAQWQ